MRYGIPLLGNRVAPRCTYADSMLLLVLRRNRISTENNVSFLSHSLFDLTEILTEYRVDTLICGGISRECKEYLHTRSVDIIDNVACTIDEIIEALREGKLHSGFGLSNINDPKLTLPNNHQGNNYNGSSISITDNNDIVNNNRKVDCLACSDRVCMRGAPCSISSIPGPDSHLNEKEILRILEASLDIAYEKERTLCRLTELIYFCLEMKYKRLGIAYCVDLQEPADILTHVLRRFFEIFPVCCKVGGVAVNDPLYAQGTEFVSDIKRKQIACNPVGQAQVLNSLGTDLNIIVGICMGADCIFTKASDAPVTTLFVKDRSLANNPIGAVYSDYYLDEATKTVALKK